MSPSLSINPELLELDFGQSTALNRRTQIWLLLLLALVMVSAVMLALFLQSEENGEKHRQRAEDTQWLEQSLNFHFRRLETDLTAMAFEVHARGKHDAELPSAGGLWRSTDAIKAQGWIAARQNGHPDFDSAMGQRVGVNAEISGILDVMLDTALTLGRPTYAGPLKQGSGTASHQMWVAVPIVERGQFAGNYVAIIDLEHALDAVVPTWFLQDHQVEILTTENSSSISEPLDPLHYIVPVNLNGAELRLQVNVLASHPRVVPRIFFGIALLGLAGMLLALYFFFRDTVKRVQAESQLKAQISIRTAMERSVTLGLRAWDLNGTLLYVNQAFCRMVDRDSSTLLSDRKDCSYWPADQASEATLLQDIKARPELQAMGTERRLLKRDGETIEVLLHYAPLALANGTTIGWICSTLDVTDRRKAERLALRQQEVLEASARLIAVGEVASTLAHELNQPLGALSSFSNGLLNRLEMGNITLEEVSPVVARIEKMAEKAGRIIQRVNAFARRQEMTRQPLDLIAFVKRVSQSIHLSGNVELDCELPDLQHVLAADALLLEHALNNLVLNAVEWAAPHATDFGKVRIRIAHAELHTGVTVEDSGPGVPPDKRGGIFDAFTSHKAGGMGMGLSICRSIVEAHHGRIEVSQSEALGGAQFTLWLPNNT